MPSPFFIVIGVTIFMEGMGKKVDKELIYVPMGFAMAIQFLQMRHKYNLGKLEREDSLINWGFSPSSLF